MLGATLGDFEGESDTSNSFEMTVRGTSGMMPVHVPIALMRSTL
jgi:hypothetical protein